MDDKPMWCPICERVVAPSDYLAQTFRNDWYGEWMANLVTHYRHQHLKSWDRANHSGRYRSKCVDREALGYEAYKIIVNNRAKRKLMRAMDKHATMSIADKMGLTDAVGRLQNTEPATLKMRTALLERLQGQPHARQRRIDESEGMPGA